MTKGSSTDFESLLHPQFSFLYRISYRLTGNKSDAEDLLQDLLVKLYPRRKELEMVENLRPWLIRVLYRLFLDNKRKQKRLPLHLLNSRQDTHEEDLLEQIPSTVPDPEQCVQNRIRSENIEQALSMLSKDHQAIIVLHDIEGYRLKELEMMLEVPLGTLKSRLSRAREILRKILENHGSF